MELTGEEENPKGKLKTLVNTMNELVATVEGGDSGAAGELAEAAKAVSDYVKKANEEEE